MDIKLTIRIYSLNVHDLFYIINDLSEHGRKEGRHARW